MLLSVNWLCNKRYQPGVPGTAKVNNLEWTAISQDTVNKEAVRILDIEGVKLIVEKNETKS